jgi:hypothetical protein
VLIAVSDKRWLISINEEEGHRLENPEDAGRIEIVTALDRGIRVIPILMALSCLDLATFPRFKITGSTK